MAQYQVLARKYRPQTFSEVIGQDAIVTTLKNAIKNKRLAHAYLFCGSRGTGKTTLARVFAKALNCLHPTEDNEPCNTCASCKEITSGNSLDVLEVDGASHRGIDDVRQINETVGFATSSGGYKIYIIDEVHMLTKEAFNALLKTLEEPPARVMFLFATTEPHKVLPTILSRCQRFNLNRISLDCIIDKLRSISTDLKVTISDEALRLIALRSDGGLRDAESLLDQIISFNEGDITLESVSSILGIMSRESLFALDRAGKEGNLAMAFEIAHQVHSQGKDIVHFVESLTEHFRYISMIKLAGKDAPFLPLSQNDRKLYEASAKLYSQEQCLSLLDFLVESQQQVRFMPAPRIGLEAILLRILRSHQRLPVEFLIKRLSEIEEKMNASPTPPTPSPQNAKELPKDLVIPAPKQQEKVIRKQESDISLSIDPTPSPEDLGMRMPKTPAAKKSEKPQLPTQEVEKKDVFRKFSQQEQSRYDTLLNFAAIELEGTIKKQVNR